MSKRILVGLPIGVIAAAFATCAVAQTKWQMPVAFPLSNFQTITASNFAADAKKRTGGKLEIVVHPGASLVEHFGHGSLAADFCERHEPESALGHEYALMEAGAHVCSTLGSGSTVAKPGRAFSARIAIICAPRVLTKSSLWRSSII